MLEKNAAANPRPRQTCLTGERGPVSGQHSSEGHQMTIPLFAGTNFKGISLAVYPWIDKPMCGTLAWQHAQ